MHPVDLVGYGANYRTTGDGTRPRDSWVYPLVRTYAPTQLIEQTSVTGADYLKLASNPSQGTGGIIYGDSGGPVLDGGTDVALGDNAYGNRVDGVAYSQRIDIPDILGWIRSFLR